PHVLVLEQHPQRPAAGAGGGVGAEVALRAAAADADHHPDEDEQDDDDRRKDEPAGPRAWRRPHRPGRVGRRVVVGRQLRRGHRTAAQPGPGGGPADTKAGRAVTTARSSARSRASSPSLARAPPYTTSSNSRAPPTNRPAPAGPH